MDRLKKCPVSDICGGCSLQHLSYEEQLQLKQDKMDKLFSKMIKVKKIIGADDPYHYRNKVQMAFSYDRKRVICGNYVESTHHIVEVKDCQISDSLANSIIETIKKLAISFKISIFNEYSYQGCLRHVMVRLSKSTGQVMVILVTGSFVFPRKKDFMNKLLQAHSQITTIVQSINNRHTSMVLGEKFETWYGKGYIEDELNGLTFKISPSSFYQVNSSQTVKLYGCAIEAADLNKDEVVIDAYCGTGTIGLSLASKVKKVIGVELNKDAIKDAKINAKINGITNAEFICADAGNYMQKTLANKQKVDVLIMDPPRSGADDKFLKAVVKLKPKKIVYISCNPYTQKENVRFLLNNDYKLESVQPVDMFPFTDHVETVAVLSRVAEKTKFDHVD